MKELNPTKAPIQEIEQEHHDKIVGIIAEKIEAERRPAPHGWKLVPAEPTPDWIANLSDKGLRIGRLESAIEDMLAAAPTPPAAQASVQDDEMVSLGGTAPPVPRWLLDAVQRIGQYMDAHSPGDWAIGGVQKRQASGQSAADEIEGLRAHVALLKSALAQSERENDELRAKPAAATAAPSDEDRIDRAVEKAWDRFQVALDVDEIGNRFSDEMGNIPQDSWDDFARALLQRYGQAPAASVEPRAEESTQAQVCRAWNEGFEFALRASGWQEGEDPATEGLYVVRDSNGNIEVGLWHAKTFNGQPAEWSKEFRDVDRDDIVAWIRIPPYVRAAAIAHEQGD